MKIDQSLSHDGVCLTVVKVDSDGHWVTAVKETLDKSSLGNMEVGTEVNPERAMKADGRFDGHIVQGHVDTIAKVVNVIKEEGSWVYRFSYEKTKFGAIAAAPPVGARLHGAHEAHVVSCLDEAPWRALGRRGAAPEPRRSAWRVRRLNARAA